MLVKSLSVSLCVDLHLHVDMPSLRHWPIVYHNDELSPITLRLFQMLQIIRIVGFSLHLFCRIHISCYGYPFTLPPLVNRLQHSVPLSRVTSLHSTHHARRGERVDRFNSKRILNVSILNSIFQS